MCRVIAYLASCGGWPKFVRRESLQAIFRAATVNPDKYARKFWAGMAQTGFEPVTRPFTDLAITTKLLSFQNTRGLPF